MRASADKPSEPTTRVAGRIWIWLIPLLLTAWYLRLHAAHLPLELGDDAWYLQGGVDFHLSGFVHAHFWSPLYATGIHGLSLLIHDPIRLYRGWWAVLIVLTSLIPAAFLNRYASTYSLLYLLLTIPLITPLLGAGAGVVALFGLCVLLRRKPTTSEAFCLSCVTCFVMASVRPEFDYALYLAAAGLLCAVVVEMKRGSLSSRKAVWLLGVLAVTILLTAAELKFAVADRAGVAFAQSVNSEAAHKGLIPLDLNTWRSNYAEQAYGIDTQHNAGNGTATMGDFFRAKPRLFAGHLLFNLRVPQTLAYLLVSGILILAPWKVARLQPLRPATLMLAPIFLIVATAMIVIDFRWHYAAIALPSLLLLALEELAPARWLGLPPAAYLLVGATLLFTGYRLERHFASPFEEGVTRQLRCLHRVDGLFPAGRFAVYDPVNPWPVFYAHPRAVANGAEDTSLAQLSGWVSQAHPIWVAVPYDLPGRLHTSSETIDQVMRHELGYVVDPCERDSGLVIYRTPHP